MRLLGTLVLLVLLAACSSSTGERDGPSPVPSSPSSSVHAGAPRTLPTRADEVWTSHARSVIEPVVSGDTLVAVVQARGDELDIVGLDAQTGERRWRAPFQTTPNTSGIWPGDLVYTSAAGEELVVYQLARAGAGLSDRARPYVAVEPDTGAVLARTRPLRTAFGPVACDDGVDVCLRVGEQVFDETRWVLGDWTLRPERDRVPGANQVGSVGSMYAVNGAAGGYRVTTALVRAGPDGWRRPARAYVRGDGWRASADDGWYDPAAEVIVLTALPVVPRAAQRRYESGRTVALDQSRRRLVGVDARTGRRLWQRDGADFRCLDLAVPDAPVRCAVEGDLLYRDAWERPRPGGLDVSLEGFDPRTGDTTWSFELSRRASERVVLGDLGPDEALDRVADGRDALVVPGRDGSTLLSLDDGSSSPVGTGEAVLCRREIPWRYALDFPGGRSVFGEQRARHVVEPCRPGGVASDRPLGVAAVMTAGTDVGEGVRVVALADRLVAYRTS